MRTVWTDAHRFATPKAPQLSEPSWARPRGSSALGVNVLHEHLVDDLFSRYCLLDLQNLQLVKQWSTAVLMAMQGIPYSRRRAR